MNKVYKVIWNAATGSWTAVSELGKSKTKTKSVTLAVAGALAIAAGSAQAANVVEGEGATAKNGDNSVVLGNGATVGQGQSVAIGNQATTTLNDAVAIGSNSQAISYGDIAIGLNAKAEHSAPEDQITSRQGAIAIGVSANATNLNSVSIGNYADASAWGATAFGNNATADGTNSTALGRGATATGGTGSIAAGTDAIADGQGTSALGSNANASALNAAALGYATTANGSMSAAVGSNAISSGTQSTSVGAFSKAEGNFAAATGTFANAAGDRSVATGAAASATGDRGVATGYRANAEGANSTAVGTLSKSTAENATTVGSINDVSGANSTAVGTSNTVTAPNSAAIGTNNTVTAPDAFVFGSNITDPHANSIILGANSAAAGYTRAPDTTVGANNDEDGHTYTYDATKYAGNANLAEGAYLSIGAVGDERQLKNLAAGEISATSTDGVNGSQLYAVMDRVESLVKTGFNIGENNTAGDVNQEGDGPNNATSVGLSNNIDFNNGHLTVARVEVVPNANNEKQRDAKVYYDVVTQALATESADGKAAVGTDPAQSNGAPVNTGTADAPVTAPNPNALTTAQNVADAINASGWVTTNTDGSTAVVNPGDKVNFVDGTGTVANVVTEGDTTTVKFDLKADSKTVKVDPTSGEIQAVTSPITQTGSAANGDQISTTDTPDALATAGDVVNAVNSARETVTSNDKSVEVVKSANTLGGTNYDLAVNVDGTTIKKDPTTGVISANLPKLVDGTNTKVTATVGENGETVYSIDTNKDVTDITSITITGPKGADGANGEPGKDGDTAVITVAEGPKGVDGKDGADGAEGKTRIVYTQVDPQGNPVLDPQGNPVVENVATLNDGLKFVGNDGNEIIKKLNETVTIRGGADLANPDPTARPEMTDSNIGVVNENGELVVKLAKDVDLGANGSLNAGTITIPGVDAQGNPVAGATTTLTTKPGVPVATDGKTPAGTAVNALSVNGNQITDVANGQINATSTDAINGAQLYEVRENLTQAVAQSGWKTTNSDGTVETINPNDTVNFVNGTGTVANVVTKDGVTTVKYDLNVDSKTVKVDPTSGEIQAVTSPITQTGSAANGDQISTTDTPDALATAGDVVNAVNSARETVTSNDKSVEVVKSANTLGGTNYDLSVKVDSTTITKGEDGKLEVATGDITVNPTTGKVNPADTTNGTIATVGDVVNAINNAGWTTAVPVLDAQGNPVLDAQGNPVTVNTVVNPGDAVNYVDGKGTTANVTTVTDPATGKDTVNVAYDVKIDGTTVQINEKGELVAVARPNLFDGVNTKVVEVKDAEGKVIGYQIDANKDVVDINSIQLNGPKGADGTNGKDGATLTVEQGPAGVDGKDGESKTRIVYQPLDKDGNPVVDANGNPVTEQVATLNDGLKFVGDDGQVVVKKLNETLGVKGGATGTLTDGNIGVQNVNGELVVKLAEQVNLGANGSVTAGNVNAGNVTAGTVTVASNGGPAIGLTSATGPSYNTAGQADGGTVNVLNVGTATNPTRLAGVANGEISATSKDAINGSQLYNVANSFNNNLNAVAGNLNGRINDVEDKANAGTAGALATAGLPQVYLPGKNLIAVAAGTYEGKTGYAVGFSSISDGGNWILKGTASGNSESKFGGTIGLGYQW